MPLGEIKTENHADPSMRASIHRRETEEEAFISFFIKKVSIALF